MRVQTYAYFRKIRDRQSRCDGAENGRIFGICLINGGISSEALAKAAENSTFSTIQKMMKNMKITAEQALAALEIPLSEQPKYLAKL